MSKGAALIAGASSGIGAELAKLCAAGGYDVVLVARSAGKLADLAAGLSQTHGIAARALAADLADPAAPQAIFDRTRGVARDGYRAMMAGKAEAISGARNRWMIRGTRPAPRTMLAGIARRLNSNV